MILLEIDRESIALVEFEGNAPRAIDMNRVAKRNEAAKRMKIEARQVHVFGRSRGVKGI